MSISAGSRLGPYEILSPLGAGGMGEVYRARDPRLGRELAVKVLPAELSADAERLTRFEQEARSASALNHPNIVTIYEIGRADSLSYIAMELVSGKTLREILVDGAIPIRRLLPLAAQLADGLARAHEAGIVHRDLKPENVMVTRDGVVKILDFGLAKLVARTGSDVSQLPTAVDQTRPGVVLGTAGYMSPEQASGRPVDFRSDQFAFGAILYEMAAGTRAFSRSTGAETLAAIIRDDPKPAPAELSETPVALRWLIERCLAKEPEERYASTRDLARDLANLRDRSSEISRERSGVVSGASRARFPPLAIAASTALLLLAAAIALFLRRAPRENTAPAMKFVVSVPPGTTYAPLDVSRGLSVSPDGTRLAVEAYSKGRRRLFVRPLDSEEATELEGSLDATGHFWSPDSRFIAFYADGKLKKIPATGGPPVELCDAAFTIVGTWNREGTILFSNFSPPGIFRVSAAGGEAVRVVAPAPSRQEAHLIWPQFLPDGRRFLYIANLQIGAGVKELRVGSLDTKETKAIARLDSRAEYAPSGHLLFVRRGALFAQPFEARTGGLRGEPVRLADGVHYFFGPAHAAFSVSQTGVLAYQAAAPLSRLAWIDRSGKEIGQLGQPAVLHGFRILGTGARVAAAVEDRQTGTSDVWIFETDRGVSTRLHFGALDEGSPVWSPDGVRVVYRSDRRGPPDIYQITVGSPESERPLLEAPGVQQPEDISSDGRFLVFVNGAAVGAADVWLLPLRGEGKPFAWLATPFNETSPRFSPDGRWIAYESNESGVPEIYAALTEGAAGKRRLSPSGGRLPRWRSDGKELYYIAPNGTVMAVPVTLGAALETGTPAPLFQVEPAIQNYDVTADGTKFLATVPLEKTPESPLRVIVNWPALLQGGK